jgi:hypothetical protein
MVKSPPDIMSEMLTPEMLEKIEAAVQRVAQSPGWGAVAIVIEKGRVAKLQDTTSNWLNRDKPPPRATATV